MFGMTLLFYRHILHSDTGHSGKMVSDIKTHNQLFTPNLQVQLLSFFIPSSVKSKYQVKVYCKFKRNATRM